MATSKGLTAQRLEKILERQGVPRWGKDYQPAVQASAQEAPRDSRPETVYSSLLARDIHCMSEPEMFAAFLALYNPRLFDLHEQKMLSMLPSPHPLTTHPFAAGMLLPPVQGTVKVMERLGVLNKHPMVEVVVSKDPFITQWQPFPYLGDFLLFLLDDFDIPYCVNWTVKKDALGYKQRGIGRIVNPMYAKEEEAKAERRHVMEEEYHKDASIRTVRITWTDIDEEVAENLRVLCGYSREMLVSLKPAQYQELVCDFNDMVNCRVAPFRVFTPLAAKYKCRPEEVRVALHQAIWKRQLRVDLFRPILANHPLHEEECDILDVYKKWFEG